jgi:alpha-beta hydrolase superfamily lysophospholipase
LTDAIKTLDEPGSPTLHVATASDGYRWHYRRFAPPAEPIGRVIFLHGIQSHGGWYPRSSSQIAAAGYEVFFLERRGCGLNIEQRGDLASFRRALDDIAEFVKALPADKPRIMAAISWGGKLGVGFQYRHPGLVDGLALLCPGFFPKIRSRIFERLWIGHCNFHDPARMFPIPLSDPTLFTESEKWREFLRNDPLALHEATARMLFQSNALDIYLRRAWRWVKAPTLLMLAEHDRIIINAKTLKYFNKFRCEKEIIVYPGAQHTLEFEPEGHPFVNDLLAWMGRLVTSTCSAANSRRA